VGIELQETSKASPSRIEALRPLPESHEDFLGHVLGELGAPQHAVGNPKYLPAVPTVRLGERIFPLLEEGLSHGGIVEGFGIPPPLWL
jgi:hypothetical protein